MRRNRCVLLLLSNRVSFLVTIIHEDKHFFSLPHTLSLLKQTRTDGNEEIPPDALIQIKQALSLSLFSLDLANLVTLINDLEC